MARIDIDSTSGGGSLASGVLQLQNGVAMDATLRNVADQANTVSPLKLSTTIVQVTSPLRITTDDASDFYLDCEDGSTNNRFSIKRNTASQQVNLDFASNPSGSTTTVGAIRTFRDGVNLSEVMTFREDGNIGIGTTTPIALLHLRATAASTRQIIDGDAGQSKLISYRTNAVQRFGLYVNNTAEGGSNAGSNFAIRAYNDAGTLLTTPFFINRSTGNVGINTLTPTAKTHIVGSGSTSATTSLLVQNSLGTNTFSVNDAGTISLFGTNIFNSFNTGSISLANNGQGNILLSSSNSQLGYEGNFKFGSNNNNASARVQIDSTTQGFLPPRMSTAQKVTLAATATAGLMIYDTNLNKLCVYTGAAFETITSV